MYKGMTIAPRDGRTWKGWSPSRGTGETTRSAT